MINFVFLGGVRFVYKRSAEGIEPASFGFRFIIQIADRSAALDVLVSDKVQLKCKLIIGLGCLNLVHRTKFQNTKPNSPPSDPRSLILAQP